MERRSTPRGIAARGFVAHLAIGPRRAQVLGVIRHLLYMGVLVLAGCDADPEPDDDEQTGFIVRYDMGAPAQNCDEDGEPGDACEIDCDCGSGLCRGSFPNEGGDPVYQCWECETDEDCPEPETICFPVSADPYWMVCVDE